MTVAEQHRDFTSRLLPALQRIAKRRCRLRPERDRLVADFLGDAWGAYALLSRDGKRPSLRRVLRTTARMRTSTRSDIPVRLLSLSDPLVRERVEAIPA